MKILIVNNLYFPYISGGAEQSVQLISENLSREGYEVVVVTLAPKGEGKIDYVNGVKIYYIPLKNIDWPFDVNKSRSITTKVVWHIIDIFNASMAKSAAKVLDKEKPDIVHTNVIAGFSVSIWKEVKRRNIPLVHTIRDYYLLCIKSALFKANKTCIKRCLECRAVSNTRKIFEPEFNGVVGNSHFVINKHVEYDFFKKTKNRTVIHNIFDSDGVTIQEKKVNEKISFGYIGRIFPSKGIDVVLDVLERDFKGKYEIWLAGKGPENYINLLKSKYNSKDIYFMGFVSPKEFFKKIDVLFVPSIWYEPLPRTIFEGYGHGVPVISSNRGGIPEIVEENKTGFIFDPDKPKTLVKAISNIIEDRSLIYRMKNNVISKSKEFYPKYITNQYVGFYKKILNPCSRNMGLNEV